MPDHVPRETEPAAFDFSGLTPGQELLLAVGGWEPGKVIIRQPLPQVAQKLVDRGLVTVREVAIGLTTVRAYDVSPAVAAAWRAHVKATGGGIV